MKIRKSVFFMLSALLLAAGMAGCGKENPKSLARETYNLSIEALGAIFNPAKTAELEKKAEEIAKKVEKLSESDKVIYNSELERLTGQIFGGLLNLGNDLNTKGALNAAQQALDFLNSQEVSTTTQQALDLLNSQDVLTTTQQAMDAAQQALNLLNQDVFNLGSRD